MCANTVNLIQFNCKAVAQAYVYRFTILFALISVQTECCKLWHFDNRIKALYKILKRGVDIWLPGSRGAGEQEGLQLELEDIQREDELTLFAACRWSNRAPASARQWGYHRWSTTGTPPRTASRHLKGDKPMKNKTSLKPGRLYHLNEEIVQYSR